MAGPYITFLSASLIVCKRLPEALSIIMPAGLLLEHLFLRLKNLATQGPKFWETLIR
jgi:hypothetical protein